ncbi:NAD(P)/FAD-dependent oxidoreductase [Pseudonocardia sp.]|uniref:NAD(P)/FAD-dependent oxidoreductase n=1 Tax=Pseudonocardia sp. TaxID=60912 RepID=UPI00260DC5D5|nr:NAD(P)/FAD-dependent oxidoreductase [Pseudonocardia sp.]MCW2720101.1 thioredoxin reductase [Pseudonocardia sp.]
MDDTHFDVIVIGGGTAGLSGALTLARARRSVLVIDAGEPRNAPADGIHGYLTRDGLAPSDLVRLGEDEVTRYGGQVVRARATSARADGPGFAVGTDDGREVTARRLLVTTGLVDELPDIPGLRDLWGHDVLHCPYCHGWEVRDQPVGVLATSPFAVHQALLFRQWSPDVTLFLHTSPDPAPDEWEQLAARDIAVVDGEVTALETRDGRLSGVRLTSGRVVPRRALAVMPRFVARGDVLAGLGLAAVDHAMGVGQHVAADVAGLTSVPGVRVAGNVTDLMAGVVGAAAAGVAAAAALNADLVADDARRAVEQRRSPFSAASGARVAEIVTGERRHGLTPARS